MTVITFDTLKYSRKLIEAGVSQRQAEGQAEALAEMIDDRLATKKDLQELEMATKRDLQELEVKLEMRLLTKLGGLTLICTAILGVLISVHH